MNKVTEFLQKLESVKKSEDVADLCEALCSQLGIANYLLAIFYPYSMQRSQLFYITNYPGDWITYYLEKDLKKVDPIVLHSWQSTSPILWQSVAKDSRFDHWKNQEVMRMAAEMNLVDGVSVPIHGASGETGILSFSSDKIMSIAEQFEWMSTAQIVAPFLHIAIEKINLNKEIEKTLTLTNREKECLLWVCDGKTSWEISTIINVGERTVNFHLNSTIKKLGCSNRSQAIAKALLYGIIKPEF